MNGTHEGFHHLVVPIASQLTLPDDCELLLLLTEVPCG